MDVLEFSMAGPPKAKLRPRATVRNGHAQVYTAPETRKYEASVTVLARKVMGNRPPLQGPLSVALRFRMPIPKSETKAVKALMLAGEIAPITKPDLDNMTKAILDGLAEDAALKKRDKTADARVMFRNDSQITRLFVTKVYAEKPGVDVRVEAYELQPGEVRQ